MKARELIGSQVLALASASMCGTVCGVIPSADCKKIKALEVFMNDEDDCEKKILETSKITACESGTVTVRYADALVMCYPAQAVSPINLPAYSEKGENFGHITDIILDDKFNILSVVAGKREFALGEILSRSDDLIVFRLPGSKTRLPKAKKKKVPVPAPAPEKRDTTVRITGARRYSFLMGRKMTEDVRDTEGLPVAAKGEAVTDELINLAREKGAIVRLTMAAM